MSSSSVSALGASPGAGDASAASTTQSPEQRISALQRQQSRIDAEIAATKANAKLSCSDIDSKVGSLKTQSAQITAQLQRVESQQRQSALQPPRADAPRIEPPASGEDRNRIHVIA
jgi:seryl-tRNA synthetase